MSQGSKYGVVSVIMASNGNDMSVSTAVATEYVPWRIYPYIN